VRRYDQLPKLVAFNRPKTIVEVGVFNGARAGLMCREALKHREKVHYTGYDLFDSGEQAGDELNSKGRGSIEKAIATLDKIKSEFPGFTYELVKGNTHKTLHGRQVCADFVFIDGGHSVETIKGDYEALKTSRMIALDDWYSESSGLDTEKYGCNKLLESVPHEVLPWEDRHGIRIAVIGYDSRWRDALDKVVREENIDDIAFWRGENLPPTGMVSVVGLLERLIDPEPAIARLREITKRKLFFVLQADALRSLDSWKALFENYFQILEWFPVSDGMVVGTAKPLLMLGELNVKGALTDDVRMAQVRENSAKIAKRVGGVLEPHDRIAILACYGPSLRETWQTIIAEKKYINCDLVTVSGAHDFLIKREIIPDYHVECDPRPHKAKHINLQQDTTKYLIASCCHPNMLEVLDGKDMSLWHMMDGPHSFEILDHIDPDGWLVNGGGSVGLRAISLMYALGYRAFRIHGMDCSFASGAQHAGKHAGKRQNEIQVRCGSEWFETSGVMVTYAQQFFDMVERMPDAEFDLHGHGLQQAIAIKKHETKQETINAA
jgi:hypothetical protein